MHPRIAEIQAQIAEHDLSRATRRILDLFLDFHLSRSCKIAAMEVREEYNLLSTTPNQEAAWGTLVEKIQAVLSDIEKEILPEFPDPAPLLQGINPNTPTQHSPQTQEKHAVVSAKALRKSFISSGHTFHLPPVDLDLMLGEITGIVGENGNGKTTLMRMIAGDLAADGGRLEYPLFGSENDWYDTKSQIAYIPQHVPKWNGYLKTNLHFSASLHGLKGQENEEYVDFIIHRLGLSQYAAAKWTEISGGYKLRFELARALVWRPKLLIIDEPLAHLDINAQQIFMQDLRYLASSSLHPMAVMVSSQHLHEVERIADNILFIKNGKLLYNGKMTEFGSDRKENLFEIATPHAKSEIETALQSLEGVSVGDTGNMKIIHTPVSITSSQILTLLGSHSLEVQYFRDISTSTLKLFRDLREQSGN